jgi:hypothetical protein
LNTKDRVKATAAASVFLLLGVGIGVTGANANRAATKREPCVNLCNEIRNAKAYADWCGGYVQVINDNVSVERCDR